VELVLNLGDVVRRRQDGAGEAPLRRMLVGQMDRPGRVRYEGRADLLGIRFHPAGAAPLLRLPLTELTGQIAPLDAVFAELDRRLHGRVDPDWTLSKRVAAVEEILLDQLDNAAPPDHVVAEAVRLIQEAHGQVSVSWLMDRFDLSARQLERRFLRAVGLGPKLLCRVLRFRQLCEVIDPGETPDWAAVALECGYYDQSHLIRDCRQFSGLTPTQLFELHASARP
jgi:AraC-like DNA-binding protein